MDQAQREIERILDRVQSLDDLSADDVIELRRLSEHSLVLNKFKVSPTAYRDWLDKIGGDIRGVEYDAQNAYVVLKGCPGFMHEAATGVLHEFLVEIRKKLNDATGLCYYLSGSQDTTLDGKSSSSTKQADASLTNLTAEWPVVVLEVGVSETTTKLYQDAEGWLNGTNGQTKLVILIDIQEKGRWNTSNDKWELSKVDIQGMRFDTLSNNILQWYRSKGIRLYGSFKLSVHLWYSDDDRQCIYEAAFSPDKLIDTTNIVDVSLRMEHLMPDGSDSDIDQPLLFPLSDLVHLLQNGFETLERERANNLANIERKKYLSS